MRSLLFCTGWAEPCRNHGASYGPVALTAKYTKAGQQPMQLGLLVVGQHQAGDPCRSCCWTVKTLCRLADRTTGSPPATATCCVTGVNETDDP